MMYLHRKDIKLISEIMAEFPEVETFRLVSEEGGGIGTTLKLTITTKVFNRPVDMTFEISGVENW